MHHTNEQPVIGIEFVTTGNGTYVITERFA